MSCILQHLHRHAFHSIAKAVICKRMICFPKSTIGPKHTRTLSSQTLTEMWANLVRPFCYLTQTLIKLTVRAQIYVLCYLAMTCGMHTKNNANIFFLWSIWTTSQKIHSTCGYTMIHKQVGKLLCPRCTMPQHTDVAARQRDITRPCNSIYLWPCD